MSNSPSKQNVALVVLGMCGSGKSSLAQFLSARGWPVVRFGEVTMDELKRRGLPIQEANERAVREELRRVHGMAAFAILSLPAIEKHLAAGGKVVIDGLYSWTEFKWIRENLDARLVLIAVFAPKTERYRRLAMRPVRPLSAAEAESRDFAEIERLEKGGAIAFADQTIMNDGSIQELEEALLDVLRKEGVEL
jgi:dephospho-CoA kinase